MDEVDFGYVDKNKFTIYLACFQKHVFARTIWKRSEAECETLISKIENVFEFLVEEGNKQGFDVDSILEIPSSTGLTCFSVASGNSKQISEYIIRRSIQVNSIGTEMVVPDFKYPDLAVPMMKKGINPHIISHIGISRIDMFPSSFKSEVAKQLLAQLPRSIHFSIEDIKCGDTCAPDCPSAFKRFYFKNGEFVEMTDANRIGGGGFSSVYKGSFHGKEKALKCVFIEQTSVRTVVEEAVSDLEENISEIRVQMASGGSGIMVPEAFVRQQNQLQDTDGEWIAENYNIYIFPLYDCNLYELHENHYNQFTDEILIDILSQCLTRKYSSRPLNQLQKRSLDRTFKHVSRSVRSFLGYLPLFKVTVYTVELLKSKTEVLDIINIDKR